MYAIRSYYAVQVKQEQTTNAKQTIDPKEEEKTLIIQPQESMKISEPDSDSANQMIRQRTNHLIEKMD